MFQEPITPPAHACPRCGRLLAAEADNECVDGEMLPPLDEYMFARVLSRKGNEFVWEEIVPGTGGSFEKGPRSGGPGNDPARESEPGTLVGLPCNAIFRREPGLPGWILDDPVLASSE